MMRPGGMRLINQAIEGCLPMRQRCGNPFRYLYLNPSCRLTLQFFAKWTQIYVKHQAYAVLLRAAEVTGYEAIPQVLFCRNQKQDGVPRRTVRVGQLTFYLLKPDEMTPGLAEKYSLFKKSLAAEVAKGERALKDKTVSTEAG